jgi:hypothetical protein
MFLCCESKGQEDLQCSRLLVILSLRNSRIDRVIKRAVRNVDLEHKSCVKNEPQELLETFNFTICNNSYKYFACEK